MDLTVEVSIMQRCGVFLRKDLLYIDSYSRDEFGLWVGGDDMLTVKPDSPRIVGETIIEALNASLTNVPQLKRDEIKKREKKMYRLMGVKTWAELEKTSTYTNLERKASVIKIYPQRIGRGGGFDPCGPVITCSSTDVEEIGLGVLKALKLQNTND